jgi:ribosomal protein S18
MSSKREFCKNLNNRTKKQYHILSKNLAKIIKKNNKTAKHKQKKCKMFCKKEYSPFVLNDLKKMQIKDKELGLPCVNPITKIQKRIIDQECQYVYCNKKCRGFPDHSSSEIDPGFQKKLADHFVILDKEYNPMEYKNVKKEMERLRKTLTEKGAISHCKMTQYDE